MAKTARRKRTVELSADELNLLHSAILTWQQDQRNSLSYCNIEEAAESETFEQYLMRDVNALLKKLGFDLIVLDGEKEGRVW